MSTALSTILIICTIIITLTILIIALFLILALIQVRRTALRIEYFIHQLNHSMNVVGRIADSVSFYADKLGSPWVKVGAWASGLISTLIMSRKQGKKPEPNAD